MISFFESIAKDSGVDIDILKSGYQIYNFGGKSAYIANFKSIITFSDQCIKLKLSKGVVNIYGQNLFIKELNTNTIIVNGLIKNIEVEWWIFCIG